MRRRRRRCAAAGSRRASTSSRSSPVGAATGRRPAFAQLDRRSRATSRRSSPSTSTASSSRRVRERPLGAARERPSSLLDSRVAPTTRCPAPSSAFALALVALLWPPPRSPRRSPIEVEELPGDAEPTAAGAPRRASTDLAALESRGGAALYSDGDLPRRARRSTSSSPSATPRPRERARLAHHRRPGSSWQLEDRRRRRRRELESALFEDARRRRSAPSSTRPSSPALYQDALRNAAHRRRVAPSETINRAVGRDPRPALRRGARTCCVEALALIPDDPDGALQPGAGRPARAARRTPALAGFERVLALERGNPEGVTRELKSQALNNSAVIYFSRGEYADAEARARRSGRADARRRQRLVQPRSRAPEAGPLRRGLRGSAPRAHARRPATSPSRARSPPPRSNERTGSRPWRCSSRRPRRAPPTPSLRAPARPCAARARQRRRARSSRSARRSSSTGRRQARRDADRGAAARRHPARRRATPPGASGAGRAVPRRCGRRTATPGCWLGLARYKQGERAPARARRSKTAARARARPRRRGAQPRHRLAGAARLPARRGGRSAPRWRSTRRTPRRAPPSPGSSQRPAARSPRERCARRASSAPARGSRLRAAGDPRTAGRRACRRARSPTRAGLQNGDLSCAPTASRSRASRSFERPLAEAAHDAPAGARRARRRASRSSIRLSSRVSARERRPSR